MGRRERLADLQALARAGQLARPVTLADQQVLPVVAPLAGLFPEGGLRRGATVAVVQGAGTGAGTGAGQAAGGTTLALALAVAPVAAGSWAALVGLPHVGLVAAAELGLALERVLVLPEVPSDAWPAVVAAVLDTVDVVVAALPGTVAPADQRRLVARARERGAVLVVPVGSGDRRADGFGADVRLAVQGGRWEGLGDGHGHLRARRVEVVAEGRRAAARPRRATVWLPGPDGRVGDGPGAVTVAFAGDGRAHARPAVS